MPCPLIFSPSAKFAWCSGEPRPRALRRCPSRQLCKAALAAAARRPGAASPCICRMAPAAPPRRQGHDRGAEVRDSEDNGSTARLAAATGNVVCCTQEVDKHSNYYRTTRLELEALISTLAHGRVYDDDDDESLLLNDLHHFHSTEKVQTWLRTTLCTDDQGRDVEVHRCGGCADVGHGPPSTFLLTDAERPYQH